MTTALLTMFLALQPSRANAQATPATLEPSRANALDADPLGAYVDEALRHNLGLDAARRAERSAAAAVREARSRFLPAVTLESRASNMSGVPNLGDLVNPAYAALNELSGSDRFPTDLDVTIPPRHETRLRLTQPLFHPGIRARHAASRARHDGQRLSLLAEARQLAATAQLAYLQVAAARDVEDIHESALMLVEENARVAGRLLAAGRVTAEAVFRAQAEVAAAGQALAESSERRVAAERAFNRLLGRAHDESIADLPDSTLRRPLTLEVDSAVSLALRGREELRAIDAAERAAQADARGARGAFLPTVLLALDYGFMGNESAFGPADDYRVASLVMSWDLFAGGGRTARRMVALHDLSRVRMMRRDLADRIDIEVRDAHAAATVARTAISAADARLTAAERVFTLVRRRFEEGAATPLEFADARTGFTNARIERELSVHRYAMKWVALERAAALRAIDDALVRTSEDGSPK